MSNSGIGKWLVVEDHPFPDNYIALIEEGNPKELKNISSYQTFRCYKKAISHAQKVLRIHGLHRYRIFFKNKPSKLVKLY